MNKYLLLFFVSFASPSSASEVFSIKDLLASAWDLEEGVRASLVGPMATTLRSRFPGTGEVQLEARVIRRFKQDRCGRFALRIIPGHMPAEAPTDMTIAMNWCLDGTVPDPAESTQ